MAVIDDIATDLSNALGLSLGAQLFKSQIPDSPNTAVAVLDTGGTEPHRYSPTKHPTFQVFIRDVSYSAGKTKLDTVRDRLHQLKNRTLGSTYFYYILALSEGGYLGRNESGIDEFSINFICLTR